AKKYFKISLMKKFILLPLHARRSFLCVVVLLTATALFGQDIHFSQFYMSPLTINPGMAGAQYDMQAILNYKNQWQSVTHPYKTFGASFDTRLNKNKSSAGYFAAGINFFSDKAGTINMGTTQGSLSLAYHAKLNGYNTFGGGLQAGFAQRSVSYSSIEWGNQYDGTAYNPALNSGEPLTAASFTHMDFGVGIVFNHDNTSGMKNVTNNHDEKLTFGLSVMHINQPKYSFYGTADDKLYMKIVAHGSAILSLPNSNVAFAPGFMYAHQGKYQEIYAGTLLRFLIGQDSKYTGFKQGSAFSIGGYFRAKDAIAATMLLEYSNYAFGFSYDVNISKLKTSTSARGGVEVTLRYVSPNPFQAKHSISSFN
ncbi:MAG TPA: PorP/SprF family type IX secretion system membrane protein, partial [Bacteroidia bacterium]|nr:PorP/SprF family type IX secretion system membrane protein [Bacteroidia bacterium]